MVPFANCLYFKFIFVYIHMYVFSLVLPSVLCYCLICTSVNLINIYGNIPSMSVYILNEVCSALIF